MWPSPMAKWQIIFWKSGKRYECGTIYYSYYKNCRRSTNNVKQKLTGLAIQLESYTREVEAWKTNRMFSSELAKVYSQCQANKMRTGPPSIQYWDWTLLDEHMREGASGQWLEDLRTDQSHLPEQDEVTIMIADIQDTVSRMNSWTAPAPDMIHTCINKRLMDRTRSDWLTLVGISQTNGKHKEATRKRATAKDLRRVR